MLFALHKPGEPEILQTMEVPEAMVQDCTPKGFIAVPADFGVTGATHIIVGGRPVLKPKEGT